MKVTQLIFTAVLFGVPILLVWGYSKINKDVPFRWANGFKAVICLFFVGFGIYGHILNPGMSTQLIPEIFRFPLVWSFLTGVIELVLAVLLWTRFQRQIGLVTVVYLIIILPFNYYGWTQIDLSPNYIDDPNYMWFRTAMQAVLIAFAYYGTREPNSA